MMVRKRPQGKHGYPHFKGPGVKIKMNEAALKQQLDRIERKLSVISSEKKKTWVKVGWVTDLTGWDREKMRQAREQGLVEFKDDAVKGRLYNIDSIPKVFIKKITDGLEPARTEGA